MAEGLDRFTRSRWLFGDKFEILSGAKGLICGCGGVGGAAIDALYRCGVRNLVVVDSDKFEITNQNRQIFSENVGEFKAEVFAKNFEGIRAKVAKIDGEFLDEIGVGEFDFVVDAIDDIDAKIALAWRIRQKMIFISSLGAGKRVKPSQIKIASIDKTHTDPFARKFRSELRKSGFNGKFDTVFSTEEPRKISNLGSFKAVTATFGNFIAAYVVEKLIDE